MIRELKTRWLALAVIVATSAMAASTAQAKEGVFEWDAGISELRASSGIESGSGHLFQLAGQPFTCNNVSMLFEIPDGSRATALETVSSTYNYIEFGLDRCVGALGFKRKLTTNGCQYRFNAGETLKAGEAVGTVDIVCPPGREITTHGGTICTVDIPPQSGLSGVRYRTVEDDVAIEIRVTSLRYRPTGFCGGGERTDGHYSGLLTLDGAGGAGIKRIMLR